MNEGGEVLQPCMQDRWGFSPPGRVHFGADIGQVRTPWLGCRSRSRASPDVSESSLRPLSDFYCQDYLQLTLARFVAKEIVTAITRLNVLLEQSST